MYDPDTVIERLRRTLIDGLTLLILVLTLAAGAPNWI